jgi:signal transduction histidine kinase
MAGTLARNAVFLKSENRHLEFPELGRLIKLSTSPVYLIKILLLAGLYFVTAKAGLSLSPVSGFATLVWPPTGIALAVLVLFGVRYWPGIFIGAIITNVSAGAHLPLAIGIATGNTLEAVIGAWLLRRFNFNTQFDSVRDVALLVVCSALLATGVSATIGTSSLLIGRTITLDAYPITWATWWVGDMLGCLIVAPFLFVWVRQYRIRVSMNQALELLLLMAFFLSVGMIIFSNYSKANAIPFDPPYLVFPFLIWAALRFRMRLIVSLNILLAAMTVLAAIYDQGPFTRGTLYDTLFASQLFIGVTVVTFLTFSALMSERRSTQRALETLLTKKTVELRKEKELEKLQGEFIAVASHELKTPLTSLKAYAQILNNTVARSRNKQTKQLAAKVDKQADKLIRLTDELLDVSRIESGNITLRKTRFDIKAFLERIVDDVQRTTQTHVIEKHLEVSKQAFADQTRIEQVVLNLIENAIKYSPKAGRIIASASETRNEIIISVQDFGPGIPKKDLVKIFRRFYRLADNSKDKQAISGIGLGLFIASKIIRQHDGKMWAESKPGKGSTFYVSLPLK